MSVELYRDLAMQFRLPVNPVDDGFRANGGDFMMRASGMSSENCCLSYWDPSVAMDIVVHEGKVSFMYSIRRHYLAPILSHLRESRNPLAKRVLEHINTDFSKDDQYAALSRVPVIDSIDGAVALVRDQVKFKEIICSR